MMLLWDEDAAGETVISLLDREPCLGLVFFALGGRDARESIGAESPFVFRVAAPPVQLLNRLRFPVIGTAFLATLAELDRSTTPILE